MKKQYGWTTVALLFVSFTFASVAEAHGTYTGRWEEDYDFLSCCGDNKSKIQTTRKEQFYESSNPGIEEQASGYHWHQTITVDCVGPDDLRYQSQCDVCEECEWEYTRDSSHFKRCLITDFSCYRDAQNRYRPPRYKVTWRRSVPFYYFYRWVGVETCVKVPCD